MRSLLIQDGRQLVLDIVDEPPPKGKLLARVPLSYSDFQLARDETWWKGVRDAQLGTVLEDHQLRVIPGDEAGHGRLDGYTVELSRNGSSFRQHFDIYSLANVAQRKIAEMVEAKTIETGLQCKYYLTSVPADEPAEAQPQLKFKGQKEPLLLERARLADYLAASEPLEGATEPLDEPDPSEMPIFVKEEAWEEGRQHAFRGGEDESAALFSGRVFEDIESSEKFVCFEACLETPDCVETKASVTFTGETWSRVRQLLDLRRRRLNKPNEIIVASVHRHPFMPAADANGRRMCDACAMRKYCSRTTAVPSTDDFEWHRSVFTGLPFCTLLIWGYSAREEEDFRLYGVRGGTFQQRSLRLLKD